MLQLLYLLALSVCVDAQLNCPFTLFEGVNHTGESVTLSGGMQFVPVPMNFTHRASSAIFGDHNVTKCIAFWPHLSCCGSPVQMYSWHGCARDFNICGVDKKVNGISACFNQDWEGIIKSLIPPPPPTPDYEQLIKKILASTPPPTSPSPSTLPPSTTLCIISP